MHWIFSLQALLVVHLTASQRKGAWNCKMRTIEDGKKRLPRNRLFVLGGFLIPFSLCLFWLKKQSWSQLSHRIRRGKYILQWGAIFAHFKFKNRVCYRFHFVLLVQKKKNETSYYSLSNSMKFDKGMLSQEINLSNADIEKKCCKKYSWLEGGKKKFFARCTLERCLGGIARENVCHKSSQASFFPFFIFYLIHTCILLHWPRKLWVGLV